MRVSGCIYIEIEPYSENVIFTGIMHFYFLHMLNRMYIHVR